MCNGEQIRAPSAYAILGGDWGWIMVVGKTEVQQNV